MNSPSSSRPSRFCHQARLVALPAALAVSLTAAGSPGAGLAAGTVLLLGLWLASR